MYFTRLLSLVCLLFVMGCTVNRNMDGIPNDGFREGLAARGEDPASEPPIPAFKPIIAEPDPEPTWADRRVTLTLDGSVPLEDVLLELAHQASLDLEMDPAISAPPMIFTAHDQPLGEVIDRLTEPGKLRAVVKNNVLRIEPDTPYTKNYRVDYPNITRASTSNTSSSLNIAAATESQNNRNDSAASTDNTTDANFWAEMVTNLTQILASDVPDAKPPSFSVNKQAGLINVRATQRQHKQVADYIKRVQESAGAQVLIEARILEVSLSDTYTSGINWSGLINDDAGVGIISPLATANIATAGIPAQLAGVTFGLASSDFNGLFNFLQSFGTVRALSSPRMTVMQNQVGTIKVVQNEVYFRLTIQTTDATTTSPTRRDITSEQRTVPIGLIMNVQPSIDLTTNSITMALRPTITKIAGRRTDPSILIAASDAGLTPQQIDSTVPVVSVQEMDSVVSLKSGQTLVMGGLMRDATSGTAQGLPGSSDIAKSGLLFGSNDDNQQKSELVVFLKATIVNKPRETITPVDRDLYQNFGLDRRPINVQPHEVETLPNDKGENDE
jgi:MSHA biogenesis protein MshL